MSAGAMGVTLILLWIGAGLRDRSFQARAWGSWQTDVFVVVCTLVALSGASAIVCLFLMVSKNRAEIEAGYSTGPYQKGSVVVLDPKTGFVLRDKDEPALRNRRDVAEARARAQELKSSVNRAQLRP